MTEALETTEHSQPATAAEDDSAGSRACYFEIWSRSSDGKIRRHGAAHGRTFQDACKHLACTSIDFWTHYDRGNYRGLPLYRTREDAMRAVP